VVGSCSIILHGDRGTIQEKIKVANIRKGVNVMKTILKKMIFFIFFSLFSLVMINAHAYAASGFQGYAIYRDGVFFNYTWHAGMMDGPYYDSYLPVLHAPGSGSYVKWDTWNNFMKGNNFKGVYRPKRQPSSSERDRFVALGRKLRSEHIPYTLIYQVNYNTKTSGTWVDAEEITQMRCDGVVEYIYEWYGFRVYGHDQYWDVTKNSAINRDHHSLNLVTPKSQTGYLSKVQSGVPKR
jgi:hypothetical protein